MAGPDPVPTDAVAGGGPTDAVAGGGPTDAVAGGGPADSVAGGGPADAVAGGGPADSVAGGGPADAVAGGGPTDAVAGGGPTDAVAGGVLAVAVDATPLLGHRTGVGTFVAAALAAAARDPGLALRGYALSWLGFRALAQALPPGVTPLRAPMPPQPLRWAWGRWEGPAAEWWTGRSAVVHGTNYVVPPTRRAARVSSIYDLTPVRYPELTAGDPLGYPRLLRRALAGGAWVHTMSSFVADEVVEELGADPERVRVVAGGIPPVAEVDPARGRALAGTDRYLLCLSTVEPRKDHPAAVRAFDRLAGDDPELRLVVAGLEAWGSGALDEAVAAARHRHRIVRLGYVASDDRAGLLRGARALVFPSRYEGFGLPPLEAMSVGVPVVATRAGSLPGVLGDAALLVDVGDDDALTEAVAAALGDDGVRRRLVAAGHERAGRFSWSRCGRELAALYREAARAAS